ncbi:MAG TPA: cupredoxin domain-containing protein [Xanthobacteraceae bacterium]
MTGYFATSYFASLRPLWIAVPLIGSALILCGNDVRAQDRATIAIAVKDHRFEPAEIHAPANRPLALEVKNLDATPMEFESVSLRVEKVIAPGAVGTVNVRPLAPGRYEFFDDFHPNTRGALTIQ